MELSFPYFYQGNPNIIELLPTKKFNAKGEKIIISNLYLPKKISTYNKKEEKTNYYTTSYCIELKIIYIARHIIYFSVCLLYNIRK